MFALRIGVADSLLELGVLYAHERACLRVQLGRPAAPAQQTPV